MAGWKDKRERARERTKPTSAKRLGKSQMPGRATTFVTSHRTRRTMARPKKAAMRPRTPTERYQTPMRILTGHKGNMTPARTTATMATARASWRIGLGSTSHT